MPFATLTLITRSSAGSHAVVFRLPHESQLARRTHVPEQRRRRDHGGAREITFAAHAHAVRPVAIERSDGALSRRQGIGTLPEAGAAPRLADLPTHRTEHVRDRLAVEPRIGMLDAPLHAA